MKNFTAGELRTLRSLDTPHKIQRFLDSLPYHQNSPTCWSPRRVLRERTAHCLEGAIFAAAALRVNGYQPLLFDLEAVQDTDHVMAVFQERGHWGSIAMSSYSGLRFREPIHRSFRELALSFFHDYFNYRGDLTLRAYSTRPFDLRRFDSQEWMTSEEDVWYIAEALCHIPHTTLLRPTMEKSLHRVCKRSFAAGMVGNPKFPDPAKLLK